MSLLRVYVHAVWSVKFRAAQIDPSWRKELLPFIDGIVRGRGHTPIKTNTQADHVHSAFRFSAREDFADLMQHVKGESSRLINDELYSGEGVFRWQGGYGAFSVGSRELTGVVEYIRDQDEIHERRKMAFAEEYATLAYREEPIDDEKPHWFDPLA